MVYSIEPIFERHFINTPGRKKCSGSHKFKLDTVNQLLLLNFLIAT